MPRDPSDIPPAFIQSSPLLREAFAMALAAHHGWRRRGDTDIEHPVAVAALLYEHEIADEEVLAAALLHDVIEERTQNSPRSKHGSAPRSSGSSPR